MVDESHFALVNAGASVAAILVLVVCCGILLAGAAFVLERRGGSRSVWVGWSMFVAFATAAGALSFEASFPGMGTMAGSLYTIFVFVGVPSAAAAWAVVRTGRAASARWTTQVGFGFLAFVLALPVGIVLAALPDVTRMIG